jgi:hypothetical protein
MAPAVPVLGLPRGPRYGLSGSIASAAFTSGHGFVIGLWDESPLGPMSDVMWRSPDGKRVLLVPTPRVGRFISAVYRFDAVEAVPVTCHWDGPVLRVVAGDIVLALRAGRRWAIPLPRLRGLAPFRWVEAPIARRLLGVRTFGSSPTGVFEWYRADQYRSLVVGHASWAGTDLGPLTPFDRPTGFGFSEPPRRPAVVRVRPMLIDPGGDLTRCLAGPGAAP